MTAVPYLVRQTDPVRIVSVHRDQLFLESVSVSDPTKLL